jgi:hypothetical protein
VAIISKEMQIGVVPFRGKIETVMLEHTRPTSRMMMFSGSASPNRCTKSVTGVPRIKLMRSVSNWKLGS